MLYTIRYSTPGDREPRNCSLQAESCRHAMDLFALLTPGRNPSVIDCCPADEFEDDGSTQVLARELGDDEPVTATTRYCEPCGILLADAGACRQCGRETEPFTLPREAGEGSPVTLHCSVCGCNLLLPAGTPTCFEARCTRHQS